MAFAFFASLERCSCINLSTSDDDNKKNEAQDRPLVLPNSSVDPVAPTSGYNFDANIK
ncbi:hypothetical protein LINPERPRIM_LOCUS23635 [Linum perenne]